MTTRSLVWAQLDVLVPAFTGSTTVAVPIACSYDMEVASAKYLHSLPDGEAPLALHFNGIDLLPAATTAGCRWCWSPGRARSTFRMPVVGLAETIEHYYPNTGWVAAAVGDARGARAGTRRARACRRSTRLRRRAAREAREWLRRSSSWSTRCCRRATRSTRTRRERRRTPRRRRSGSSTRPRTPPRSTSTLRPPRAALRGRAPRATRCWPPRCASWPPRGERHAAPSAGSSCRGPAATALGRARLEPAVVGDGGAPPLASALRSAHGRPTARSRSPARREPHRRAEPASTGRRRSSAR